MESHIDKKFYVPEIEEFHVGFEYEFRTLEGWKKKTMSWNDYPSYAGDYIGEAIKETDGIRVKYLDREDIESLGFKYIGGESPMCFVKDNVNIDLFNSRSMFVYYLRTQKLFEGTIKNKSELKRVLKMLGI